MENILLIHADHFQFIFIVNEHKIYQYFQTEYRYTILQIEK